MKETMNPKKGDKVRFWAMNEFTGANTIVLGTVIGHGKEVRKMWPYEMAHAPDNTLLVKRVVHGIDSHYAVIPHDVDSIIKKEEQ